MSPIGAQFTSTLRKAISFGHNTKQPRSTRRRLASLLVLSFTVSASSASSAEPAGKNLTGAELFTAHCQTCHSLAPSDPPRQGPNLHSVFGRKAGSLKGFAYSKGFASADWVWDEAHLHGWLAGPQNMIADSYMLYRQPNAEVRQKIISYLKDQSK